MHRKKVRFGEGATFKKVDALRVGMPARDRAGKNEDLVQ